MKIADIVYSPYYGCGWSGQGSTRGERKILATDPEIVEAVRNLDPRKAYELAKAKIPDFYWSDFEGNGKLELYETIVGSIIKITEFDGYEKVEELYDDDYFQV